jgi:hypothetical protein
VTTNVNPPARSAESPTAGRGVEPASADPSKQAPRNPRRDFLRSGSALSMSSLMGTAALMAQPGDAKAAVEWAEHFQKNYRLMTPEEKANPACGSNADIPTNMARRSSSIPPRRSPVS